MKEINPSFKGVWLNGAAKVESNILLNKGITDIGRFVIPEEQSDEESLYILVILRSVTTKNLMFEILRSAQDDGVGSG